MVVVNLQQNEGDKEPAAGSTPVDKQGDIKGQTNKPYLARLVIGTVKWFNVKSGYGFINRKDTGEDVFVHQSAIIKNNPKKAVRSVGDGETVEFDVVAGDKGNEAANVTGPGGVAVKGSPYAADKRRGYRQWFFRVGPRTRTSRKLDGEEAVEAEEGSQNEKRRFRNKRFVGGGRGYYPRRHSNRPDRNGEKDGDDGGDEGGEEDGQPTGEQRAQRGAPRGRGGRGRRYSIYRGGRQGQGQGPPKSRQQQGDLGEGGPKEGGGGGEGGNVERVARGGGRGGRGRPRYRRPQRSQSQGDKTSKNSEGWTNSEGGEETAQPVASSEETTQAVQNTTDESAA